MLARDDKFRQGLETARLLKLEGDPGFGAQLAAVLNDRVETGQTSSLRDQDLDFLEKWLESFPPLADKHQSQKAARRFLAQGKKRLARFLCPEATERQEILESLDCLLEGRSEHSCWDGLARDARPTATHPAAEIARLLRRRFGRLSSSQRQAFMEQGWSTFRSVAQRHLIWTSDQQSDQTVALPVLQLAAVLQPHRGLGSLAAEVVEMAWKNPRIHQPGWWRELVVGLQGCPRLDGLCAADDCPEAAYALTRAAVRQLAGDDKRAELACGHLDAAAEALPFLFSKNSEFFAQKSPKSS